MMRRCFPSGARRPAVVFALVAFVAHSAVAQELSPFGDPDERQEQLEPPLSLPEGLRGIVRPQEDASPVRRINRIAEVFQAIQACWRPPAGSGFSGQELTLRISFKRSGEVLGQPRITFYKAGTEAEQREPFTRSVRQAFERCAPLPFTERLGAAVAGRPFVFRFVDSRPM
jgi:hypothetical protein